MKSSLLRVFLLLAFVAGLMIVGCSDDNNDTDVVITDDQLEAALATLMRQSNTMLDSVIGGGLEPSDYDFRPLHAVFVGYLAEHPGHKRASFGAALSSMMILTTNSELNRLFDSLMPDGSSRFAPPARLADLRRTTPLPSDLNSVVVRDDYMVRSYFSILSAATAMPIQFSEIQAAIKSEVLPALNNGLTYVGYILDDTSFVFWITPQMMQDTTFDSTEIDHTDFLALATGMRAIKAVLHVAVAYNVDLTDLRAAGIMEILDQSGSWMSLHTDGAAQMAQAKSNTITAINLARETVDAAYHEPVSDPDQDDDLLTVSWDSLTYQEYIAALDDATEAMTQPTWFDLDPEDDVPPPSVMPASLTMDSVRVDLRKIFDDPLQVPASFAPAYTYVLDSVWTVSDSFYVLTLTWDADSLPDWHFPDPTFHGLFPDITNDSLLADFTEYDTARWDKVEYDTIHMSPLELIGDFIEWLPDVLEDR